MTFMDQGPADDLGKNLPGMACGVSQPPIISVSNLNVFYGNVQVLFETNLAITKNLTTAFMGPSGCGKSTLLRCFNRLNDLIDNCRVKGDIEVLGLPIHSDSIDVSALRRSVGMVFQKPNPFPMSIFENVAYGLRISGVKDRQVLAQRVEESLSQAGLWEETKDRLKDSALALSGGQQQRLCIARALAPEPQILLMDEPTSALDPIASGKIEDLIKALKDKVTTVIVTHNLEQAFRVSDEAVFFYLGKIIEHAPTKQMFENPKYKLTRGYVTGRFG